jgi:hypothetical protein
MTALPGALLRLLGVGGRPAAPGGLRPSDLEKGDFQALLRRAESGDVASGREVTIDRGAALTLAPEQLARLAVAADRAEATGAHQALVLIDGQALRLDVDRRQVTGAADLGSGLVLTDIDAVVSVPGGADAGATRVLPMPQPSSGALNPSLLEILGRAGR